MLRSVQFKVPGVPRGKGRPKFYRRGAHVGTYTDDKTAAYENLVRLACGPVAEMFKGPVHLDVRAMFPYPKSWSKKRVEQTVYHTSKPDLDNIVKAVKDGLNGVLWLDDSCVCGLSADKSYTEAEPCLIVYVKEMGDGLV